MSKLKLLVVDDDCSIVEVLTKILEKREFKIRGAYDGLEALERFQEEQFDLVLMDIKMPEMNGVDVLKEMKRINPAVEVILMSAYSVEDLRSEALKEGVVKILDKPFEIQELINLLQDTAIVKVQQRFGARVRATREGKGWSQGRLSEKSGLHRVYLSNLEQGKINITLKNMVKIAQALEIELTELLRS